MSTTSLGPQVSFLLSISFFYANSLFQILLATNDGITPTSTPTTSTLPPHRRVSTHPNMSHSPKTTTTTTLTQHAPQGVPQPEKQWRQWRWRHRRVSTCPTTLRRRWWATNDEQGARDALLCLEPQVSSFFSFFLYCTNPPPPCHHATIPPPHNGTKGPKGRINRCLGPRCMFFYLFLICLLTNSFFF